MKTIRLVTVGILLSLSTVVRAELSGQHWAQSQNDAMNTAMKIAKTRCEQYQPTNVKSNCLLNTNGKPTTWDSGPDVTRVWMCELTFKCKPDPEIDRKPL